MDRDDKNAINNLKPVDWGDWDSKAVWHINNETDFYNSLAISAIGIAPVLSALLSGEATDFQGKLGTTNVKVTVEGTGDALYDRLFVPLYKLLGITEKSASNPNGFASASELRSAIEINRKENPNRLPDYGRTFWRLIFNPLFYWMNNTLFP